MTATRFITLVFFITYLAIAVFLFMNLRKVNLVNFVNLLPKNVEENRRNISGRIGVERKMNLPPEVSKFTSLSKIDEDFLSTEKAPYFFSKQEASPTVRLSSFEEIVAFAGTLSGKLNQAPTIRPFFGQ